MHTRIYRLHILLECPTSLMQSCSTTHSGSHVTSSTLYISQCYHAVNQALPVGSHQHTLSSLCNVHRCIHISMPLRCHSLALHCKALPAVVAAANVACTGIIQCTAAAMNKLPFPSRVPNTLLQPPNTAHHCCYERASCIQILVLLTCPALRSPPSSHCCSPQRAPASCL
jgi:hypothetical protein